MLWNNFPKKFDNVMHDNCLDFPDHPLFQDSGKYPESSLIV